MLNIFSLSMSKNSKSDDSHFSIYHDSLILYVVIMVTFFPQVLINPLEFKLLLLCPLKFTSTGGGG